MSCIEDDKQNTAVWEKLACERRDVGGDALLCEVLLRDAQDGFGEAELARGELEQVVPQSTRATARAQKGS